MDRSNTHTDRVSFPFDNISFSAPKPLDAAYPAELATIGDHLRKRRLDLGLCQKQVAKRIGVTTDTITNWELNRTEPEIQYYPAIIDFLGYVPFEIGNSLPERLKAYRMIHGLSQKQLALQLKVDESTLWKWEKGQSTPSRTIKKCAYECNEVKLREMYDLQKGGVRTNDHP